MPGGPELFEGSGGGIFNRVFICGGDNLRKFKELGDVFGLLIANGLLNSLLHTDLGRFAFDNGERNAVEKEDKIRPGIVKLILAVHRKFFSHVE